MLDGIFNSLTQKKARAVLAQLPAAFKEIQDRHLISQASSGMKVVQRQVFEHYDVAWNKLDIGAFDEGDERSRYSNECACFGAHMHTELWLASMKAFKMAAPDNINRVKRHVDDGDVGYVYNCAKWNYTTGIVLFDRLLSKFPQYRKFKKDRRLQCKEDALSSFLETNCGGPWNCFSDSDWPINVTPVSVLTKLNEFLNIETVWEK